MSCVHLAERRCDLDSGADLLAFVCARCGRLGFRAFATPKHAIAWKKGPPGPSHRESAGRERFADERARLSRPSLVPPSFTRARLFAAMEPRS